LGDRAASQRTQQGRQKYEARSVHRWSPLDHPLFDFIFTAIISMSAVSHTTELIAKKTRRGLALSMPISVGKRLMKTRSPD